MVPFVVVSRHTRRSCRHHRPLGQFRETLEGCNSQHLELAAFYPKIAVAYTRIVTITTDNILGLNEFRGSVGATWTFLSDPGRKVQKDLQIQEYTDPHHDPMIPHTLVLKPGLVIHSLYNGYWFWGRPSVEELWRDLRAASSEIRPDWDLAKPGLRAEWDAGNWTLFHGWEDKTPEAMATTAPRAGLRNFASSRRTTGTTSADSPKCRRRNSPLAASARVSSSPAWTVPR